MSGYTTAKKYGVDPLTVAKRLTPNSCWPYHFLIRCGWIIAEDKGPQSKSPRALEPECHRRNALKVHRYSPQPQTDDLKTAQKPRPFLEEEWCGLIARGADDCLMVTTLILAPGSEWQHTLLC